MRSESVNRRWLGPEGGAYLACEGIGPAVWAECSEISHRQCARWEGTIVSSDQEEERSELLWHEAEFMSNLIAS
jgi:hypothetical protein